jgi:hypothetical protein
MAVVGVPTLVFALAACFGILSYERAIREKLGPLPSDVSTNEAEARKQFLGQ